MTDDDRRQWALVMAQDALYAYNYTDLVEDDELLAAASDDDLIAIHDLITKEVRVVFL